MKGAAPTLLLRLYIIEGAANSVKAIANVSEICQKHFAGKHRLEVVDLLLHPARALADGIIVTPTLLKVAPLPVRRIIGNLSETEQVLLALGAEA